MLKSYCFHFLKGQTKLVKNHEWFLFFQSEKSRKKGHFIFRIDMDKCLFRMNESNLRSTRKHWNRIIIVVLRKLFHGHFLCFISNSMEGLFMGEIKLKCFYLLTKLAIDIPIAVFVSKTILNENAKDRLITPLEN